MEIMHLIYRDDRTGKIWEHIGGQQPRELSEDEVKFLRLDVSTIPVINHGEPEKVICPNCGNAVRKAAFCSECGTRLAGE